MVAAQAFCRWLGTGRKVEKRWFEAGGQVDNVGPLVAHGPEPKIARHKKTLE